MLAWAFDGLSDRALFQTGWFVESLLSQTLIVHVIRTGRVPFIESRPSRTLLVMTARNAAPSASGFRSRRSRRALGLTRLPAGYWWALAAILGELSDVRPSS